MWNVVTKDNKNYTKEKKLLDLAINKVKAKEENV